MTEENKEGVETTSINEEVEREEVRVSLSGARILMYLNNASKHLRYPVEISKRLKIDYCYTARLLRQMNYEGWIQGHKLESKTMYSLTGEAPLTEALSVLVA